MNENQLIENTDSKVDENQLITNKTSKVHEMISLAYKLKSHDRFEESKTHFSSGDKVDSWEILSDSKNSSNAYKAVAFLNKETKEIHIATAGTVPTNVSDLYDDFLINFRFTPKKITPMQNFVSGVLKKLGDDVSEYTFSTSGHSLGAVVSDLTACEIVSRGLKFNKSITFENPGSKKVVETAIKNNQFSGKEEVKIEKMPDVCEVYNADRNFINTMDEQLGKKIVLVLKEKIQEEQIIAPKVEESKSSGLFGFGKYLYNKVGSTVKDCSEKLGITSVINQIEEHSLKNFKNIDDCAQIQMDNVHAYSRHGSLIIENSQEEKLMTCFVKNVDGSFVKNADGSAATILKDIASTGKDWGFIKNGEDGDFNVINFKAFARIDLLNRINEQKLSQEILDNDRKNSQVQKVEGLIINEEEKEDGFILVGNEDSSNPDGAQIAGSSDYYDDFEIIS